MKRIILFMFALLLINQTSFAYDFSAVASSGQTLYYTISGNNVSVTYPNTSMDPWGSYTKPVGNLIIPNYVTYSGITYPVTSIESVAFYNCTGLTSATIPNIVTSIGCSAFSDCTGLTSVTIPNSVTSIGHSAFGNCTGLTSVVFNADSCTYAGAIYSSHTNIVFDDCTNITSFTFGNNVKVIPACLCYGLTGLTSVTIPNSVTSIGNYAFRGCHGLTSVTIGNSVTSIGDYAFEYCYGLTTITIPNSVTNIGACAFYQCTGLASVTIPNSVTTIGVWAFRQCTGLTSVTIGNSVTSIGGYAFEHCTGLTSVTIGNSVTSIGLSAFSQCTGLSIIKFLRSTPPTFTSGFSSAFAGIPSNYMVGVPCGSLSQYSTVIPSSHLRQVYYELSAMSDDDSAGAVQILTGPSCSNHNAVLSAVPADGYRFDHWSTGSTDNPYTLTVTSDTTITAFFEELETYSLTLLADNPTMGSVTGGGVYMDGSSVTITAFPADGYIFDHWSTSSTDNPDTLTITSDTTITAFFIETHTVTILVDNPAMGSVTGGGVYVDGSSVTITAFSADGYRFDHWSTGSTDNPYTLTVTSDTTITAFFVEYTPETYNVTVIVDNPATGSVTGGGVYEDGSSVTITAYPADGYHFDHWSTGSTDNPYSLTVTSDTTITAFFEEDAPATFTVTVLVDNPAAGSVDGGGEYEDGTSATITAYPANGYHFDHWSTGSTDNPYTLTVTSDTTITAYFVSNGGGTDGIGEIGTDDIRISVSDGRICVEGIENEEVRVYDITGRWVQNHSLPSGVYIVKIGILPAQKVVVMR